MTPGRRLLRIGAIGAVAVLVLGAVSWVGDRVLGDDFAEGYHLTAEFEAAVGLYPFGDVSSMPRSTSKRTTTWPTSKSGSTPVTSPTDTPATRTSAPVEMPPVLGNTALRA